jgi:ribosome silencing factor RsfS/YbeB/iojap
VSRIFGSILVGLFCSRIDGFVLYLINTVKANEHQHAKGDKTDIAEYFVLANGTSSTHVKALAGEVEFKMEERDIKAEAVEGRGNNAWIVLDYSHIIVHVFSREAREFYDLDRLYGN